MVSACAVCGAEQSAVNPELMFHRLPKNPDTRKKWLEILKKKENIKCVIVCSQHFTPNDYRPLSKKLLKENAVPFVNLNTDSASQLAKNIQLNARSCVKYLEIDPQLASNENISRNVLLEPASTSLKIHAASGIQETIQCLERNDQSDEAQKDFSKNGEENATSQSASTSSNIHAANREHETVHCLKRKSNRQCDDSKPIKKRLFNLKSLGFFRREDFTNEDTWLRFSKVVDNMRKHNRNLQHKNERLSEKINTFSAMVKELEKKNLLTNSVAKLLEKTCSPAIQQIFCRLLDKKEDKFPDELKQFVCTLHFYSPAAYEYVRKSLSHILPHQSTIRKWLTTVNNSPGITAALKRVSEMCTKAEAENKKLYFSITCDEMSIKKSIDFDGKQWHGFVDIGNEYENDTEATNALVFMLVGINSYFKIVIAYYFIHVLTGKEKSNILSDILHVTHTYGISVRNVTFDGANSNIAMVEELGARIHCYAQLKTTIEHPVTFQLTTVVLDPSHMIKLVRNTLAAKGSFVDPDGKIISWHFLEKLVDKQELEGLHLANKIRKQHINFQNEKMKVSLAVQVFSSSVANALKTCEHDLKLHEFQGASSTAEFCQIINDIFDLLNSRNFLTKNNQSA